jgi:hypothetical protein
VGAAVIGVAGVAAPSHADVGPVTTLRFTMPGQFGAQESVWRKEFFEPHAGWTIVGARLSESFDTASGPQTFPDAARLVFRQAIPVGGDQPPLWEVSGRDLGWSGPGLFGGSAVTHAFDGRTLLATGGYAVWTGEIACLDKDRPLLGGALKPAYSYWEFDVRRSVPAPASALGLGGLVLAARRRRR